METNSYLREMSCSLQQLLEAIHVAFIAVAFTYGLGKHFTDLEPYNQKMTLFYAVGFIELFAVTPCMFGRLSFAVFLLALLSPTMKWKRWILWLVMIVQLLVNAVVVSLSHFVDLLIC